MNRVIIFAAAAIAIAGCETTEQRVDRDARLAAEVAAKQGERVDRICFTRNINGWRAFDRDTLLLEKGVNDWYQVELAGACDPQWAFNAIGLKSFPSSSCLTRGDKIIVPDDPISTSCFITEIYEWDDDAEVEADE